MLTTLHAAWPVLILAICGKPQVHPLLPYSSPIPLALREQKRQTAMAMFGFQSYPIRTKATLMLSWGRRLFTSFFLATDRFELSHRTIAEFLAAEDLAERIKNGLLIDRVMALICGIDGKPVSSLRGLFAWLMCRLGHLAEGYVERDPYGVATYGDASVLPPNVQGAIWTSLRELRDPWFLTHEDDRGVFRDLANPNTAKIIHELLQAPTTGVHLKIAVLEAIANSAEHVGLNAIIRNMVLEKHDNTWLRSTALKAFRRIGRERLGVSWRLSIVNLPKQPMILPPPTCEWIFSHHNTSIRQLGPAVTLDPGTGCFC